MHSSTLCAEQAHFAGSGRQAVHMHSCICMLQLAGRSPQNAPSHWGSGIPPNTWFIRSTWVSPQTEVCPPLALLFYGWEIACILLMNMASAISPTGFHGPQCQMPRRVWVRQAWQSHRGRQHLDPNEHKYLVAVSVEYPCGPRRIGMMAVGSWRLHQDT